MNRYLLYLSYIGTNFRGVQRQVRYSDVIKYDKETIQGCVELALRKLYPVNEDFVVTTSSRTDAGVHALQTTVHVDLERLNGEPFSKSGIIITANKYFNKWSMPIRVTNAFLVPDTFHCRYADSRSYIYRFAIIKADKLNEANHMHHIPIELESRILFKCTNSFDLEKCREVCKLFLGRHDFRTFMAKGSKDPDKITRRFIQRMDVVEVPNSCYDETYSWPEEMLNVKENYKFYNIYVKSSGFLYKQVGNQFLVEFCAYAY